MGRQCPPPSPSVLRRQTVPLPSPLPSPPRSGFAPPPVTAADGARGRPATTTRRPYRTPSLEPDRSPPPPSATAAADVLGPPVQRFPPFPHSFVGGFVMRPLCAPSFSVTALVQPPGALSWALASSPHPLASVLEGAPGPPQVRGIPAARRSVLDPAGGRLLLVSAIPPDPSSRCVCGSGVDSIHRMGVATSTEPSWHPPRCAVAIIF